MFYQGEVTCDGCGAYLGATNNYEQNLDLCGRCKPENCSIETLVKNGYVRGFECDGEWWYFEDPTAEFPFEEIETQWVKFDK